MIIEMKEHNPQWALMYADEAEKIKEILGDELAEIYHIGSTSVEGLKAKPVIDIMGGVKNVDNVDEDNDKFMKMGY